LEKEDMNLKRDVKGIQALLVAPLDDGDSDQFERSLEELSQKLQKKRVSALLFVIEDIASQSQFEISKEISLPITKSKCVEKLISWVSVYFVFGNKRY
jgi:hypothetical protein